MSKIKDAGISGAVFLAVYWDGGSCFDTPTVTELWEWTTMIGQTRGRRNYSEESKAVAEGYINTEAELRKDGLVWPFQVYFF